MWLSVAPRCAQVPLAVLCLRCLAEHNGAAAAVRTQERKNEARELVRGVPVAIPYDNCDAVRFEYSKSFLVVCLVRQPGTVSLQVSDNRRCVTFVSISEQHVKEVDELSGRLVQRVCVEQLLAECGLHSVL